MNKLELRIDFSGFLQFSKIKLLSIFILINQYLFLLFQRLAPILVFTLHQQLLLTEEELKNDDYDVQED